MPPPERTAVQAKGKLSGTMLAWPGILLTQVSITKYEISNIL